MPIFPTQLAALAFGESHRRSRAKGANDPPRPGAARLAPPFKTASERPASLLYNSVNSAAGGLLATRRLYPFLRRAKLRRVTSYSINGGGSPR